ncbi:MAG: saccharopine dehydrogenase NADP-binding domain-containing protein [Clostridiales Family XIII bacterium]|jgi:hypothetical protein|nr:saccharopine dehydrogenase NADP-binding domain-containing protein [Clostridiales Family XIII bacterium]
MMEIGVLGCGGVIGRGVVASLAREGRRIRGGQRSACGLCPPGFEWKETDAANPNSLAEFCEGCHVVVNCLGPSYRYSEMVAHAAAAAGAVCVDTFGVMLGGEGRRAMPGGAPVVIGAGNVPGLTGILAAHLARYGFEKVDSLRVYCGGIDSCGFGAAVDILLSSLNGYGLSGQCLIDRAPVPEAPARMGKTIIPGFPEEVYVNPYVTWELADVADRFAVHEVHGYNVVSDESLRDSILRQLGALASRKDEQTLAQCAHGLMRDCEKAMFGKHPWYAVVAEAAGTAAGRPCAERIVVSTGESNRLTSRIAALAAEKALVSDMAPGVQWAWEFLDSREVIKALKHENDLARYSQVSLEAGEITNPGISEEGEL